MNFSSYYQAIVEKEKTWLVVGILRSFEHVAFDRALDTSTGTFEFFVSPDLEAIFLDLMSYFKEIGLVRQLVKLPNRLEDPYQQL